MFSYVLKKTSIYILSFLVYFFKVFCLIMYSSCCRVFLRAFSAFFKRIFVSVLVLYFSFICFWFCCSVIMMLQVAPLNNCFSFSTFTFFFILNNVISLLFVFNISLFVPSSYFSSFWWVRLSFSFIIYHTSAYTFPSAFTFSITSSFL